jgi:DNA-binding CsgD family transcriptional regulator
VGTGEIWTDTLLTFVKWCQGRIDIQTNLDKLATCFGAEIVSIARWDAESRTLRLAGSTQGKLSYIQPSFSSGFADAVCGQYVDSIKPGSVLFLSEALDNKPVSDARLAQWMYKRGIREIAVICLGAEGQSRDLIELHFSTRPDKNWDYVNTILAPSFAEVYAGRQQGLMLEALLRQKGSGPRAASKVRSGEILSLGNPSNLTRAEWKICALIANGLSRDGIAKELAVKPCTVRTHLRNIYAKCGYDRFHELALHLVSQSERAHLVSHSQGLAA